MRSKTRRGDIGTQRISGDGNVLCYQCGLRLPAVEFGTNSARPDGLAVWCKKCHSVARAARYARDKGDGRCASCGAAAEPGKTRCGDCNEKVNAHNVRYRKSLKSEVLAAYGGAQCACCGETRIEFLSIDHINGNGTQHRKEIGAADFYKWLRTHRYPPGFRVLCLNCNFAVGHFAQCPHEKERVEQPSYFGCVG